MYSLPTYFFFFWVRIWANLKEEKRFCCISEIALNSWVRVILLPQQELKLTTQLFQIFCFCLPKSFLERGGKRISHQ